MWVLVQDAKRLRRLGFRLLARLGVLAALGALHSRARSKVVELEVQGRRGRASRGAGVVGGQLGECGSCGGVK